MSLRPAPTAPPAAPDRPRRPSARRRATSLHPAGPEDSPYLYVAPFFVIFARLRRCTRSRTRSGSSLHDWSPLERDASAFVGLDNFAELITDDP